MESDAGCRGFYIFLPLFFCQIRVRGFGVRSLAGKWGQENVGAETDLTADDGERKNRYFCDFCAFCGHDLVGLERRFSKTVADLPDRSFCHKRTQRMHRRSIRRLTFVFSGFFSWLGLCLPPNLRRELTRGWRRRWR